MPYDSKCQNLHGHNWIITVFCKSEELDQNGMVVDFSTISKAVKDAFDHQNLNEVFPGGVNPTAENLALLVISLVPNCYKVSIQESEGNKVTLEI